MATKCWSTDLNPGRPKIQPKTHVLNHEALLIPSLIKLHVIGVTKILTKLSHAGRIYLVS